MLDNIFVQGDGHSVCEDYSWSGLIKDEYPCIIISDGCSGSVHTDIGARIMVRSLIASLNIADLSRPLHKIKEQIDLFLTAKIDKMRDAMELPIESLDATVRMVMLLDNKLLMFNYGDGYTVFRNHTTNETNIFYVDYPFNAPYYFNYTMYDRLSDKYIDKYKDIPLDESGEKVSVKDHVEKSEFHWSIIDINDLDNGEWTVSVMSDGVETFYKGNDNFKAMDVVSDITDFKNFRGEFVQRKVGMYLSRHAKNNVEHYDDISVASMKFEVEDDDE